MLSLPAIAFSSFSWDSGRSSASPYDICDRSAAAIDRSRSASCFVFVDEPGCSGLADVGTVAFVTGFGCLTATSWLAASAYEIVWETSSGFLATGCSGCFASSPKAGTSTSSCEMVCFCAACSFASASKMWSKILGGGAFFLTFFANGSTGAR